MYYEVVIFCTYRSWCQVLGISDVIRYFSEWIYFSITNTLALWSVLSRPTYSRWDLASPAFAPPLDAFREVRCLELVTRVSRRTERNHKRLIQDYQQASQVRLEHGTSWMYASTLSWLGRELTELRIKICWCLSVRRNATNCTMHIYNNNNIY